METGIAPFGSVTYSKEELAAEFTACFLCHLSGITNTTDNSAAYIKGWASKLRSDRKLVLQGASQGQKAADFILGDYRSPVVTVGQQDASERSLEDKLADLYPVRGGV